MQKYLQKKEKIQQLSCILTTYTFTRLISTSGDEEFEMPEKDGKPQ